MPDQIVMPLGTEGWGVRSSIAREPSAIFETKDEAIDFARSHAEEQNGSLFVQGVDGKLTKEADHHTRENPVEIQSVQIDGEYTPRLDEEA